MAIMLIPSTRAYDSAVDEIRHFLRAPDPDPRRLAMLVDGIVVYDERARRLAVKAMRASGGV